MLIEAFITAFALIIVTEMGDKTQLITVAFAARYDRRLVFAAVFLAMAVSTVIGVAFGGLISEYIPLEYIRWTAVAVFIVFGAVMLLRPDDDDDGLPEGNGRFGRGRRGIFLRMFAMTLIGEMGDKTQLVVISLAASFAAPLEVLSGALAGFAIVVGAGVVIGSQLGKAVRPEVMRRAGGVLFIVLGALMAVQLLM